MRYCPAARPLMAAIRVSLRRLTTISAALGFPRVMNSRIDIGSFEVQSTSSPTPTPTPTTTSTPTATATIRQLQQLRLQRTRLPQLLRRPRPQHQRLPRQLLRRHANTNCSPAYAAQIQQPIDPDGTSVFNVKRGVIPVKFTLTLNGMATCNLPSATIAVTRTAGGTIGPVGESVYSGPADNGSNFRIDSCHTSTI